VLADGPPFRLLPRLDDDNRFFWTSGADGRLRFLRCGACETYVHPPAPVCPRCLTAQPSPEPVSGRAVLESFTVNYQQWIPESEPYMIAWVSIVEQPDVRLTTNLVGVDAESVLRHALTLLGPRQREILTLVAWEDLTVADAGRVLGMPPGTARRYLHQARMALRNAPGMAALLADQNTVKEAT